MGLYVEVLGQDLRSPSSLAALITATLRVHRARKRFPPPQKPSFSSLRARNLPQVQMPSVSVALAFLDSVEEEEASYQKLSSTCSDPWGLV